MSAFSAGTALGPALGGILVDTVGLHPTFYVVGLSFLGVAGLNRIIMQETQPKPMQFPWQTESGKDDRKTEQETVREAVKGAVGQWSPLLRNPIVSSVMAMNALYWIALAGSQMVRFRCLPSLVAYVLCLRASFYRPSFPLS
jgi:MFS family permease